MESILEKALALAVRAHAGQKDPAGEAYILHPMQVALWCETDDERCVAFLHDVLEDTDVTAEDMRREGIPEHIIEAVKLLTHDSAVPYIDYVRDVIASGNPLAITIKYEDMRHNMSRSVNHAARLEKYTPAWRILEPAYLNLKKVPQLQLGEGERLAVFACGCFWGAQHRFASRKGVVRAVAGFAGDDAFGEPTYEDVRSRKSSHLESVAVVYDPADTDFLALCRYFFEIHDPGQTGGVGPDEGPQYQSAVFYCDDGQLQTAREVIDDLRSRGFAVATQLHRLGDFYPAAEGHQNYYDKVGGQPYCHIWEKKF